MGTSLDREQWMDCLERIAAALPSGGGPVKICLIGSGACLLEAGMPGRVSHDLAIWKPASQFGLGELGGWRHARLNFRNPRVNRRLKI